MVLFNSSMSKDFEQHIRDNVLPSVTEEEKSRHRINLIMKNHFSFIRVMRNQEYIIGPFFTDKKDQTTCFKVWDAMKRTDFAEEVMKLSVRSSLLTLIIQTFYKEDLLEPHYIPDSTIPVFFSSDSRDNADIITKNYEIQNLIAKGIKKGAEEEVLSILSNANRKELFNEAESRRYFPILNTLCRVAAEEAGVPPIQIHSISENIASKLKSDSTIDECKFTLYVMVKAYCKAVRDLALKNYSAPVYKTQKYILEHLSEDLSLEVLAANANVNPSYLSRQFKKEYGVTIVEFITKRKIAEAKALLETTTHRVIDISETLGFSSHSYFSRVFFKMEGITPQEYRLKFHAQ